MYLEAWQIGLGIGITLLINLLIWVFAYGRTLGEISKVLDSHAERMDNMEKDIKENKKSALKAVEAVHKEVLPECRDTFQEIKKAQAYIAGQVDTILTVVKKIANGSK